jgi:hypothetical protein
LHHPTIDLGGKQLLFPVDLESGMYVEFESPDDCRLYDEQGRLIQWLQPRGAVPTLAPGENGLAFSCQGTEGFRSRAEVTVVAGGPPLRDRNADDKIDWSLLRRQYESPRTICAIDGRQNQWNVFCRSEAPYADLGVELTVDQVGGKTEAYDAPSAVTLENFEESGPPAQTSGDGAAAYVYDSQDQAAGCKPGVTQNLARSSQIVKFGNSSARYSATSTLDDNSGWSVKYRQFAQPADLSEFAVIGFWLYGDSGGQQFKLQLHDAQGGWQDMVTPVDFAGWRYCQFQLGGPRLKDPAKISALNIYYNAIPAGKTVTCHVDEIRALRPAEPLAEPILSVAGRRIQFPVALGEGDRLVFRGMEDCRLFRPSGAVENVAPKGSPPRLKPGRNPILFTLRDSAPREFRVVVALDKLYP